MLRQRVLGAGLMLAGFLFAEGANAFNFGDMMNPSKWMGSGRDRYREEGPWGGPGYGGYYGGPPPAGYYGPYGPGYGGYGGPRYGAPAPGYGYGTPYPATPYGGAGPAPAPRPAVRPE